MRSERKVTVFSGSRMQHKPRRGDILVAPSKRGTSAARGLKAQQQLGAFTKAA